MDANEKLRREIQELSHLLAVDTANKNSKSSLYSTMANGADHNHYRQQQQQRLIYTSPSPSFLTVSNRDSSIRDHAVLRYPNPFEQYCTESYTRQVFPDCATDRPSQDLRLELLNRNQGRSNSNGKSTYRSPYKLKNKPSQKLNESSSTFKPLETPLHNFVPSTTNNGVQSVRPTSVYINPSYFANVNTGSATVVRPHINPAHADFQSLASSSSASVCHVGSYFVPSSSSFANELTQTDRNSIPNYTVASTSRPMTTSSSSSSNCLRPQYHQPLQQITANNSSNSNTVKTKYKLDRRVKQSPVRKVTKAKVFNKPKFQSPPSAKLFKRYSMRRVVPVASNSSYNWRYQKSGLSHFNKRLSPKFIRPIPRAKAAVVIKKGRKSFVNIDGNKYIKKNDGKTLKRINAKVIVSHEGNKFVAKNGGKSLKRLSDSLVVLAQSKVLLAQQPVGVRLANRAVQKSKITLSQRIWKKKQLCMFYNRFGECKRKEDGNCPYIHDRKHVLICPKFIVEKCTKEDCKLSHDLKMGRMPPCQFFNKSKCSRENCPYPHVKSSPVVKKSAKTVDEGGVANMEKERRQEKLKQSPSRKRKISVRKLNLSNSPEENQSKKRVDPKARYYEQAPDSQPVVSIIPRPRRVTKELTESSSDKLLTEAANTNIIIAAASSTSVNESVVPAEDSVNSAVDGRRMRLMSKILRLHERVKKKESTAPQFLPFN